MKFAQVTNDVAFRKMFANGIRKKALLSFLNAIIHLPNDYWIEDLAFIKPYQLGKLSAGNCTIIDVNCRDNNGNNFIVELQMPDPYLFPKNILHQLKPIKKVNYLNNAKFPLGSTPVYFIGILDFTIGENPNYFSRHRVLNVETHEHVVQDVEFNFIELPKFTKELHELTSSIDQWTYFIKNAENLKVIPESVEYEGLKEAYFEAEQHNWTQLELDDYMRASIKEADDLGRLELAERRATERGMKKVLKKELKEVLWKPE